MRRSNSSWDIRSSLVEQRVHFGTPARGEIFPPSKVLVTEAFRYFSCSKELFVAENKEPQLEHLKKTSWPLDTAVLSPLVVFGYLQSIDVILRVLTLRGCSG